MPNSTQHDFPSSKLLQYCDMYQLTGTQLSGREENRLDIYKTSYCNEKNCTYVLKLYVPLIY